MVEKYPLKFAILADIHGNTHNLKKCLPELKNVDVIFIAGDIAGTVNLKLILKSIINAKKISREKYVDFVYSKGKEDFYAFQQKTIKRIFTLLLSLKKPVFFTHGNVELRGLYNHYLDISNNNSNIHYLGNDVLKYDNLIISGYGFCQPSSYRTAFKTPGEKDLKELRSDLGRLEQKISQYRNDNKDLITVAIFHEPPFGTGCDYIPHKNLYAGNELILQHLKKVNYDYVFVGHIHEAQCFKYLNKTLVVNPGPLVENKFAILDIKDNNIVFKNLTSFFSKETLIYALRKFFP